MSFTNAFDASQIVTGILPVSHGGTGTSTGVPTGIHTGQVQVDFGLEEDPDPLITVSASWVTSGTVILCQPSGVATADHDPEDYVVEGILSYPMNIVPGVSFDIAVAAITSSWGKYLINYIGV